jgi:hypothetical protein
VNLS